MTARLLIPSPMDRPNYPNSIKLYRLKFYPRPLTHNELGHLIGVHRSCISLYEIGAAFPSGQMFEPICPNELWRDKNERPLCNEVINLLCVRKDDQVPFFISLHGTQLKPVRAFLSALGLRKKSLYEFQATLGLKEKSNGKGKFFVIQFSELKENMPEEKEVFRAMYFQFAGHTIDQTFDAEKKIKDDLSDVPFA